MLSTPPLRILLAANTEETDKLINYLPQQATWAKGKLLEDFRSAFKNTWDVIVVSDCLPALTTAQKLNFFRKACPETPIIYVAKQFKVPKLMQAIRAGATDIVEYDQIESLSTVIIETINRQKEKTNYKLDYIRQERDRLLSVITKMRSSLDLETVFETTTEELRLYLQADRVIIYQFNPDFKGTVVAESVGDGWVKSKGAEVVDTCFQETRGASYIKDRIIATNNIYRAGLSTCHLQLLERFQVKANLIAPIFFKDQVWGLLIAHQCDEPRIWLESQINWTLQIATQFTIAVQQAETIHLVKDQQARSERDSLMVISEKMHRAASLSEAFYSVVHETRRLYQADRVVIFRFSEDWSGTFVAESVAPEWQPLMEQEKIDLSLRQNSYDCGTKAFPAMPLTIKDTYLQEHKGIFQSQVDFRASEDIYKKGFSDCHLRLLEQYQIRAYIIVPIIVNRVPWGLLCVYQNDGPRVWKEHNINLLYQIATHLSLPLQYALAQALAVKQVEKKLQGERNRFMALIEKIQQSKNLNEMFEITVHEVRQMILADRASIYQFFGDRNIQLVAESVALGCQTLMDETDHPEFPLDPFFQRNDRQVSQEFKPNLRVIADIYTAGFNERHLQVLDKNQVRAYIAVPILSDQKLWGLLMVYQNIRPRHWEENDINLVYQTSTQLTLAIQQTVLHEANRAQILELERLSQLKDNFLNTVSQELRTPMSNMHMAIHMLKSAPLTERFSRYVEVLFQECKREIALINNLVDLQHLEAEARPVLYEELSLPLWLPTFISPFIEQVRQKNQKFNTEILTPLTSIMTEPSSLEHILTELLNNACKYTPVGKQITLQVSQEIDTLRLVLSNTGVEIPSDELPHIFDKFYSVKAKESVEQSGTGLGLALVRQLVKRLNGEIWVVSGNNLTVFTISIPLSAKP